jgi:hypothetical protein
MSSKNERLNMMKLKRFLVAVMLLNVASLSVVHAEGNSSAPLVWCGLDYSKVKMIGPQDFRQPDQIFPGYLNKWNDLFMVEMFPHLHSMAKGAESDLDAVTAQNGKATEAQIQRPDGTQEEMVLHSDITDADIAEEVRGYKLKHDQGLGLVFIMDRLVKAQKAAGCFYVVFFDIPSRKVVYSKRVAHGASGIGFRNYWFTPIKTAVGQLNGMYKTARNGT